MESQENNQHIIQETVAIMKRDPLYYFLRVRLGLNVRRVIMWAAVLGGVTLLGIGMIADLFFDGPGARIYHPRHILFGLFTVIFIIPGTLGLYAWQSERAMAAFKALKEDRCIGRARKPEDEDGYDGFLMNFVGRLFNWPMGISGLLFGLMYSLAAHFYIWPVEAVPYGGSHYILDVAWYELIVLFDAMVLFYALWAIIVRQLVITHQLRMLTTEFELVVKPMHPDSVGGFGKMGDYLVKTGLVAVGMGFVVLGYSIQIWSQGFSPLQRLDVLSFWVLYGGTILIVMVVPVWTLHHGMNEFKKSKLRPVAKEFEATLTDSEMMAKEPLENLKLGNERVAELLVRYEQIEQTYPCWPVNDRSLKQFAVVAVIPFATNLLSLVFNL